MVEKPRFRLTKTLEDGTEKVLYEPTPLQLEFHEATQRNVLLWGNRGGGKSHALRWDAHMRAIANPGFTYCILRRTYPELDQTHLVHIRKEMQDLGGTFHGTDRIAHYPNGSRGVFKHCANEEDKLKVLSMEYGAMYFDELSTFEWDMFSTMVISVRVKSDSGLKGLIRGCTNPLGPSAENIMHYFVDKDVDPEEDSTYNPTKWHAIKIGHDDNPHLDIVDYKMGFSGLPEHFRKAWLDGEFVLTNALFEIKKDRKVFREDGTSYMVPYHYIDYISSENWEKIIKGAQIYRAYDHGYAPDPAVCLWIAHLGKRHLVIREHQWLKTHCEDIAKDIVSITKDMGIERVITTYADPVIDINTGADIRTIKDKMELNGVPIETSINSRELYASAIHSGLAIEVEQDVPQLQIYTRGCPMLAKTLPKQRFDDKHPLRMANTKTDHWAVALAYYMISSGSSDRANLPNAGGLRPWMKNKVKIKKDWGLN